MNPWLRLVAVFALAIAAVLFLKVLPPLIVLLFFVGGIAGVNLALKRRVKSERAEFRSDGLGLKREAWDRFGLLTYPFSLFGRCEQASIEDLRWGLWHGQEVKRFDLACSTRAGGERTRLACAIAPVDPTPLPLVVESEALGRLLSGSPFERVDVPATGAGPGYVVRCDDPALARIWVGDPMQRWLEDLDAPWGFEVSGSLAIVYGPASAGIEEPLERHAGFAELLRAARPGSATTGTITTPAGPIAHPGDASSDVSGLGEPNQAS